jgi:beta-phosphoglucomutase-like phosphatase (HAD superfamily)
MNKAIIFDMDGVLIDARDWHYEALNLALEVFGLEISYAEHLEQFNGLSTRQKLKIISEIHMLPVELHQVISNTKQDRTLRIAAEKCFPMAQHLILFDLLRNKGYKIGVYTNSIRQTAEAMLEYAGLLSKIDVLITNQDVEAPKPNPEGYLLACNRLQVLPQDTYVVEDGEYGILAAESAGCTVIRVGSPSDVSISLIATFIPEILQ